MRISAQTAALMKDVLWSHVAATGQPPTPEVHKALTELEECVPAFTKRYRPPGRPGRGRLVFQPERLDELPVRCTASQVCKLLGIHRATFEQWLDNKLPTSRDVKGRIYVQRLDLIDWLVETGRVAAKNRYRYG